MSDKYKINESSDFTKEDLKKREYDPNSKINDYIELAKEDIKEGEYSSALINLSYAKTLAKKLYEEIPNEIEVIMNNVYKHMFEETLREINEKIEERDYMEAYKLVDFLEIYESKIGNEDCIHAKELRKDIEDKILETRVEELEKILKLKGNSFSHIPSLGVYTLLFNLIENDVKKSDNKEIKKRFAKVKKIFEGIFL
ncbi:MAG: hypothetical protein QXZ20_03010 [Candidatus Aenigmatarchaeota archaeon]